jgi:hypothetical protein
VTSRAKKTKDKAIIGAYLATTPSWKSSPLAIKQVAADLNITIPEVRDVLLEFDVLISAPADPSIVVKSDKARMIKRLRQFDCSRYDVHLEENKKKFLQAVSRETGYKIEALKKLDSEVNCLPTSAIEPVENVKPRSLEPIANTSSQVSYRTKPDGCFWVMAVSVALLILAIVSSDPEAGMSPIQKGAKAMCQIVKCVD